MLLENNIKSEKYYLMTNDIGMNRFLLRWVEPMALNEGDILNQRIEIRCYNTESSRWLCINKKELGCISLRMFKKKGKHSIKDKFSIV